jgi:hypothetical protein
MNELQTPHSQSSFKPNDTVLVAGTMNPIRAKILELNHWYAIRVESDLKCPYGAKCYRERGSVRPYHRMNEPIGTTSYHGPMHWHILGIQWKDGNGNYYDTVKPQFQQQNVGYVNRTGHTGHAGHVGHTSYTDYPENFQADYPVDQSEYHNRWPTPSEQSRFMYYV